MNLSDYEFYPGSIIDVDDPKQIGRVKANVPTVFDPSMNSDGLPWIYPFTMPGYQRFSKMMEGSKIWVLRNRNNYQEFWYVPMYELTDDSKELMKDDNYEDAEILMSRKMGNVSVYIYYNSTDGIMIKYGDDNYITINTDSEVILQAGKGQVKISGNHVYLGDGEKGEPAVMGDKLYTALSNLANNLSMAASAGMSIPYTMPMAQCVQQAASGLTGDIAGIKANNTSVD